MKICLYDTLSRRLKELSRPENRPWTLYVCGPTVYDDAHIGHARVYVVFDTLVRVLRAQHDVHYVRNFTDIDDKIILRAKKVGQAPVALAAHYAGRFEADMAALGCLPPTHAPKVSEHIDDIVALIGELVAKGDAYAAAGDVYFAVERFAAYGRLGRRALEDMEAGARVEVSRAKRHPMDFVLWKAAKPDEPKWPSPWGEGRPGWHIECSAMSRRHLGATLDMHGGGRDLIFPHHENEIAQSEAASGQPLAQFWLHNGLVNINDQKMSKSLGNFFSVGDVLKRFDPEALRLLLLSTHYRSPLAFSDAALEEAGQRVTYFYETLARAEALLGPAEGHPVEPTAAAAHLGEVGDAWGRVEAALAQDLNTPLALGELSPLCKTINDAAARGEGADRAAVGAARAVIRAAGGRLGLFGLDPAQALARIGARKQALRGVDHNKIDALVARREAARQERDWAGADRLRAELAAMGVALHDGPEGTTWNMR